MVDHVSLGLPFGGGKRLPSGKLTVCYQKWPIEIVDLPMNSMVIFHSYVAVYQRVQKY